MSTLLQGKVSWFGGPNDPTSGPTTASGSPISAGGIAVDNRETLGGFWRVTFPNGRTTVLKQTDIGPASWTGRVLDVAYSSLSQAGYTEGNFPTDSTISAEYLGKNANTAGAAGVSGSVNAPGASTSTGSGGGLPDLVGLAVKALLYVAFVVGGGALVWFGSKAALQPVKAS